jgi:hypothetical protein
MTHRLTILAGLLLLCTIASAEEWTSADGVVSVQIPNPKRFDELQTVGMLKHWRSQDGMANLGILEDQWPRNRAVRRDLLEQEFVREVGGEFVSSSMRRVNGRDLLTVTTRVEEDGITLYFTQIMVPVGLRIHRFLTISLDTNEPAARQFLDSVKVLKPSHEVTNTSLRASVYKENGELDAEAIAGIVGEMIGYLLIPGLLFFFFFRGKKSPAV